MPSTVLPLGSHPDAPAIPLARIESTQVKWLGRLLPGVPGGVQREGDVRQEEVDQHTEGVRRQADEPQKDAGPPLHHDPSSKGSLKFRNPWPSFRYQTPFDWVMFFTQQAVSSLASNSEEDLRKLLNPVKVDWGAEPEPSSLKATWLGHACFLLEFPAPQGAKRGPRILTDPVLSHRCAPSQLIGPARLMKVPCEAQNLPDVDAIIISHNHYDHMDAPTLAVLNKKEHKPHIFVPLGNKDTIMEMGFAEPQVHELDWWEPRLLTVTLPSAKPPPATSTGPAASIGPAASTDSAVSTGSAASTDLVTRLRITCTPAQHTANRSAFDRWRSLWCSYAVEEAKDDAGTPTDKGMKVYFSGDTGYRTVKRNEERADRPKCPAFQEIGAVFDSFDLALLPIGAYEPRWMWSNLHCDPQDAVEIYKDIRAKKAIAMHWGTWVLTTEPVDEPPQLLKDACEAANKAIDIANKDKDTESQEKHVDFTTCHLGETTKINRIP